LCSCAFYSGCCTIPAVIALVMGGAVVQVLSFGLAIGVPGGVVFDAGVFWLGFAPLTGRETSAKQQTPRVRCVSRKATFRQLGEYRQPLSSTRRRL
jgi:hypothetical protein